MFTVTEAPWPALPPDSAPDQVLQEDGLIFAPPACTPELLQGDGFDAWSWARLSLAFDDEGAPPPLDAELVTVGDVLSAVGETHRAFVCENTERIAAWLEEFFAEHPAVRFGDEDARRTADAAHAAAAALRAQMRDAGC